MAMLKYALVENNTASHDLTKLCIGAMRSEDLECFLKIRKQEFFPVFRDVENVRTKKSIDYQMHDLGLFDDSDFEVPFYLEMHTDWMIEAADDLKKLKTTEDVIKVSRLFKVKQKLIAVFNTMTLQGGGPEANDETQIENFIEALKSQSLLHYYLKLLMSAGVALSVEPEVGDWDEGDTETTEKVNNESQAVKLIANTLFRSRFLRDPDVRSGAQNDTKEICAEVAAEAFASLKANRLVLWRPDSLEDLYLRSQPTRRDHEKGSASYHLVHLLPYGRCRRADVQKLVASLVQGNTCEYEAESYEQMKDQLSPMYHLLIWATLSNRPNLAKYFWSQYPGRSALTALVAARICYELPKRVYLTPEVQNSYDELCVYFKESAAGVLSKCFLRDAKRTTNIVKCGSIESGGIPIWCLAYYLKAKEFTGADSYQRVVADEWYSYIDTNNSLIKVVLGVIFPPYLALFSWNQDPGLVNALSIRMDRQKMISELTDVHKEDNTAFMAGYWPTWMGTVHARFRFFLRAPFTTYLYELIFYFVFVVLFTYAALTVTKPPKETMEFESSEDVLVFLAFLWLCTLILDEIAEVLQIGYVSFCNAVPVLSIRVFVSSFEHQFYR